MTNNQKFVLTVMGTIAFFFCVLAPVVLWTSIDFSKIPKSTPSPILVPSTTLPTAVPNPPTSTPLGHKTIGATVQCRQYIRETLVVPSSAKFRDEKTYRINDKPLNYHVVTGVVESQNRLGVWLQASYRCDTHYLPDNPGQWVLDHLEIE